MKKKKYEFDSAVEECNHFALDIPDGAIKNEPMFFNASLEFAYNKGGPITKSFIDNLPDHLRTFETPAVFDSRCHMLMPGWYPAIPGFHHDDVPRPPIPVGQHFATAGQPDYDTPRYKAKHILGLVNAGVAPTQFALGTCKLPGIPDGEIIYREWHPFVERLLRAGELSSLLAPDRTLIEFDWQTFHQATPAVKSGWRWFGRVTWDSERAHQCTDEIRRQAQVYLEFPMEGW